MTQENFFAQAALLDKVIVRHPDLENAREGIEDCVAKTAAYREPVGSLLLAKGGYGKTTICKMLLASMPQTIFRDQRIEKTLVPAFYASIPSPATVKSVAASLLVKLNDPSPLAGTTANMTARLCRLLKECETRLVFLDEFHHLFDVREKSTIVNNNVCNWLKTIVNETRVSFCLVGLPEFAPILLHDSQLARRFPMRFNLTALRPGDDEKPGTLIPFLAEIRNQAMKRLQLRSMCRIDQSHSANQIYAATSGNPAFVMALIKESVVIALRNGDRAVTQQHFSEAWATGITTPASLTRKNPFTLSPGELAAHFREVK